VTITALKPNQLQVTTNITQANAIIEQVHKDVNDMLKSFDLEIIMKIYINKNMIHLITSFNQLHGLFETPIIQRCRQHHVNLCLAEI
jgi:hypothetical protein